MSISSPARSLRRLGELAPGYLQGAVAQAHQLDHQTAADADGDDERRGDGEESEQDRGPGRSEHPAGERVGAVGDRTSGVPLDGPHAVAHARVGHVPGSPGCGGLGRPLRRSAVEQSVLRRAHGQVGAAAGQLLPGCALGAAQIGDGGLGQRPSCGNGAGEQAQPLTGESVGRAYTPQQGVLLGQCLARAGELDQHARVGSRIGVLDPAQRAPHVKGGRDGRRVAAIGLLPVRPVVQDGGTQRPQPFGAGDERLEPPGHCGRQFLTVGHGVAI